MSQERHALLSKAHPYVEPSAREARTPESKHCPTEAELSLRLE